MKTTLKIILLLCIIFISISINNISNATISDVIQQGDSFINKGEEGKDSDEQEISTIDDAKFKNMSDTVYNLLLGIGIAIAVIISAVLGIKFMIGGMEEKAQIKEALVPFVIGCVVIFGAFGIWKLVVTIVGKL